MRGNLNEDRIHFFLQLKKFEYKELPQIQHSHPICADTINRGRAGLLHPFC